MNANAFEASRSKSSNSDDLIPRVEKYARLIERYKDRIEYIWKYEEELRRERIEVETKYAELRERLIKAGYSQKNIDQQLSRLMNDIQASFDASRRVIDSLRLDKVSEFQENLDKMFLHGGDKP